MRQPHMPERMPEMIPDPANVFTSEWNLEEDASASSFGSAIAASIEEALTDEAPWGHVDLEAEDPTTLKVSLPFGANGNDVHFSVSIAEAVREFLDDMPPSDAARSRDAYLAIARAIHDVSFPGQPFPVL